MFHDLTILINDNKCCAEEFIFGVPSGGSSIGLQDVIDLLHCG
jgi:hypothetical protein